MATPHSTKTGADLHQHLNVSTATLDQAYLADGNGSGVWSDIIETHTVSQVSESVVPFGLPQYTAIVVPYQVTYTDIMWDNSLVLTSPGDYADAVYRDANNDFIKVGSLTYEDAVSQGESGVSFSMIDDVVVPLGYSIIFTGSFYDPSVILEPAQTYGPVTFRYNRRVS